MSELSFGNIILAHSGKKGVLKPNEAGVYHLNAGGFNIPNAGGIQYPFNDYLREQMEATSDLNRRVSMGYCKMEVEHPQPFVYVEENGVRYRKQMSTLLEWINRLRSYDPANICGLISKIYFTPENPRDLTKPVYNYIDCEPFGPRGAEFKESLDNPRHNTAVSIRTQISPYVDGSNRKNVEYWTGYDWVGEPGMIHANKHMTAGCESMLDEYSLRGDNTQKFKAADVIEQLGNCLANAANDTEALQRVGGMEALNDMRQLHDRIKANYVKGSTVKLGVQFSSIF
ncbi:hypothetical protein CF8_0233 [Aeromonas phage CF8]|nr:hypothetical protein CF8_0233 [Aeromonas phage CF8]